MAEDNLGGKSRANSILSWERHSGDAFQDRAFTGRLISANHELRKRDVIAYTLRPDPVDLVQSLLRATRLELNRTGCIFLGERHPSFVWGFHVLLGLLCVKSLLDIKKLVAWRFISFYITDIAGTRSARSNIHASLSQPKANINRNWPRRNKPPQPVARRGERKTPQDLNKVCTQRAVAWNEPVFRCSGLIPYRRARMGLTAQIGLLFCDILTGLARQDRGKSRFQSFMLCVDVVTDCKRVSP